MASAEPRADFLQQQTARLLGSHVRVVDDLRAERDHQRRGRALAVALVTCGKIFFNAIGGAAARAFLQLRVEIKFEIRFRKNIRADVAPFHHKISKLNAIALRLLHPLAHFRNRRDVRNRRARLGRAHFLFRKITVNEQMHDAQMIFLHAAQIGFPAAARIGDGLRVVDIHAFLQAMPRQRPIHRACVHVNVAERLRHELGVRALAARARAVNGDYNVFQIRKSFKC